jgi:prophage regulatory protein
MKKTTRFLRRKEVLEITGVSYVTLWRWMDKGTFPKSFQLGENSIGWKDDEVNEWIENRKQI